MATGTRNNTRLRQRLTNMLAVAVTASFPALASFHTFQINEIYSNASGSIQFIELLEGFGADGQNFQMGHTLTVTQGSTTQTFTFPNDLPSSSTAGKHILIATPAFAALGVVAPDFIVPSGFVLAGNATVNYALVDSITYPALPADGVSSLNRNGTTGVNSPTNFAGQTGTINGNPPPPPPPADPLAIPTLRDGAIVALAVLLLVMALRRRARDRR